VLIRGIECEEELLQYFLKGLSLGVQLHEDWLCINAATYIWNYHQTVLQQISLTLPCVSVSVLVTYIYILTIMYSAFCLPYVCTVLLLYCVVLHILSVLLRCVCMSA